MSGNCKTNGLFLANWDPSVSFLYLLWFPLYHLPREPELFISGREVKTKLAVSLGEEWVLFPLLQRRLPFVLRPRGKLSRLLLGKSAGAPEGFYPRCGVIWGCRSWTGGVRKWCDNFVSWLPFVATCRSLGSEQPLRGVPPSTYFVWGVQSVYTYRSLASCFRTGTGRLRLLLRVGGIFIWSNDTAAESFSEPLLTNILR